MKNVLKCISEKEMIGASILSVDYNSDRILFTTDKGIVCIAAIECRDDWEDNEEHYMYLQEELVIGWDRGGEYECTIDIDEALELNLIAKQEADIIHAEEEMAEALYYKESQLKRYKLIKDELEKLEKELK